MSKTKILKIILAVSAAVIVFLLVFIGNFFYDVAINSKTDKSFINSQEGTSSSYSDEDILWFEDNAKEVNMTSVTNLNLVGYEFYNNSNKWIIVVHGYGINAKQMSYYIRKFYDRGYSVFAPDLIGMGKSEGEFISMGTFDAHDLKMWADNLSDKYDSIDIALFGISMGASTVMNSLDKDLSDNVKLFIADSAYVDIRDEFVYQLKKLYNLPQFPIIPVTSLITSIRAGYYFEDMELVETLPYNKLPALIMHGSEDSFVPLDNAYMAYESLSSQKKLYISEGARHVEGSKLDAENYWAVIDEFLEEYF